MQELTLCTNNNCPACERAKRWLDEHNIKFVEVNVSEQEDAAAKLSGLGFTSVPLLIFSDGEVIEGFTPLRYEKAFLGRVEDGEDK